VKLINKHYEVVLHGPCPCAPPVTTGDGKGWIAHLVAGWQGVVPQRRFFAGWLLLGLIFATYYGSWKAPVFWTALCMAMEVLWTRTKGLEAAADIQNELFGAIMGTNNRWWSTGVMAFLFCSLLCLMIALFVPAADEPVPVQSAQVLAERSQPKSLHEQRMANQQRFREYKTDTEIRAEGKTLPTAAETSTGKKSGFWLSLILPDESYMGWIIRLVITFVLIGGGTFCYTFVAFSDEFRRLVHESWEQGEQGGPKFGLMNFLGFLKNLPKNPPLLSSRPQEFSWGRLLTLALAAFEASEIVNGIRHIVARIR
jgi:hypothetical protein